MMNNNFPTIFLELDLLDNETGINRVSFVHSPATKIGWTKHSDEKQFQFEKNEMDRIVSGPIMIPNQAIYRFSEVIGPFYVKFTEATIKDTMKKYFKMNNTQNVDEEHNHENLDNVYLVESFINGERADSKMYPDLPKGTWIGSFHIEDEKYWDEVIMSDKFNGLSLDGIFDLRYEEELINELFKEVEEVLFSDISDDEKLNTINKLLNIK